MIEIKNEIENNDNQENSMTNPGIINDSRSSSQQINLSINNMDQPLINNNNIPNQNRNLIPLANPNSMYPQQNSFNIPRPFSNNERNRPINYVPRPFSNNERNRPINYVPRPFSNSERNRPINNVPRPFSNSERNGFNDIQNYNNLPQNGQQNGINSNNNIRENQNNNGSNNNSQGNYQVQLPQQYNNNPSRNLHKFNRTFILRNFAISCGTFIVCLAIATFSLYIFYRSNFYY